MDLRGIHDVLLGATAGTLAGTAVLLVPRRRRKKGRATTQAVLLRALPRVAALQAVILLPPLALGAGGFGALATSMLVGGIQDVVLAASTSPSSA